MPSVNLKRNITLTNAHSLTNWGSNLSKLAVRAVGDNWWWQYYKNSFKTSYGGLPHIRANIGCFSSHPSPWLASAPASLTAAVIENIEGNASSTDSFRWYGDKDGAEFKLNAAIFDYLPLQTFPSCCCASIMTNAPWPSLPVPSSSTSSLELLGQTVIKLPSRLVLALLKAVPLEILGAALKLLVVDTSAMDHMLPDWSAFISYKSVRNLCVRMGNNSKAPVLGQDTTIISLNGKHLLIHNVLHVPALW